MAINMGKPIQVKPPYFQECPNCHKEFGSRSLKIHVGKCKSKIMSNSSSDPDTSELSDVKTSRQQHLRLPSQPSLSLTEDEVETSLSDELSASWPAKKTKQISTRQGSQKDEEKTRTKKGQSEYNIGKAKYSHPDQT